MTQPRLHLVDTKGLPPGPATAAAVELAFRWVIRDYPGVDTALIANWAEEIGSVMQARESAIQFPNRYAYAALKGKVCDWLRTKASHEEPAGIGLDMEHIGGVKASFQGAADRRILFDQLKATLNERDRSILVMLLNDQRSPATVAETLGISYPAAAKAIQRVKGRIAAVLTSSRNRTDPHHGPARICETKA